MRLAAEDFTEFGQPIVDACGRRIPVSRSRHVIAGFAEQGLALHLRLVTPVEDLGDLLASERRQYADDNDYVLLQELPKAVPGLGFVDIHAAPSDSLEVSVSDGVV